jgi:hypothetical protein
MNQPYHAPGQLELDRVRENALRLCRSTLTRMCPKGGNFNSKAVGIAIHRERETFDAIHYPR